eukprot:CAMPEP_0185768186 /NCGR_PEP_ID=MMETSP1174-20130828/48094_1 /TAXON_ID=35687 /ORGANISM="Dictyocha speculum, Strain CCMP1381" /LENGTH=150 /DNA_ID=CAMNT_0028452769 /DNA_START=24 /DNA_END=476 /DNA_ORIENTATION=+
MKFTFLLTVSSFLTLSQGFVTPPRRACALCKDMSQYRASAQFERTTAVSAKKEKFYWNSNEGRSPWGFNPNAEVWNSRVSMMAFVWLTLQEIICGPMIKAYQSGNPGFGNIFFSAVFVIGLLGTSGMIIFNQENDTLDGACMDNIEDFFE